MYNSIYLKQLRQELQDTYICISEVEFVINYDELCDFQNTWYMDEGNLIVFPLHLLL